MRRNAAEHCHDRSLRRAHQTIGNARIRQRIAVMQVKGSETQCLIEGI
jgi:hypothetical protein